MRSQQLLIGFLSMRIDLIPDAIGKCALMKHILEKSIRYGEAYGVEDVLRDIGNSDRKEIENADRQEEVILLSNGKPLSPKAVIADQGSDPRGRSESDLGCDVSVLQRDARRTDPYRIGVMTAASMNIRDIRKQLY